MSEADVRRPLDADDLLFSIVVPVFNSAGYLGETIDSIVAEMERQQLSYELILVNDGSADDSWKVIADHAASNPRVVGIDLLRNYGQHCANLAGFREARGDYVITMDDDLQNPPDQIRLLIDEALTGRDVVFGAFETKSASRHRRLGSRLVTQINRRVFRQPPDLIVSNFRIIRRDVIDRINATRSPYPYITGQAVLLSRSRSHVTVRHDPARNGKSRYSFRRIARLMLTILFSYSVYPLRLAAAGGFVIAALSFLLGAVYLVRGIVDDVAVPGWTTLVVLLAMFNGVTIALLSMLGEYIVRTLNTVSSDVPYHVAERVGR
jgi:glycosyltransferase involved in cell wall biosynthesis